MTAGVRTEVGHLAVDVLDQDTAREWLRTHVAAQPRPGLRVCTVNLDYLVLASRNPDFRQVAQTADLAVADGMPVLWLSRLNGRTLPGRIPGSDITEWLVDGGIPGLRLFLLGSTDVVCRAVAARAQAHGVDVIGWNAAARDEFDDPRRSAALASEVRAAHVDIVLVALGAPRQDLWLARHQADLDASVLIGVGGSLDLAAGLVRRAPRLVQRLGFEWAFRLAQEPRRLSRRYLVDDVPYLIRQAISTAWRRRP